MFSGSEDNSRPLWASPLVWPLLHFSWVLGVFLTPGGSDKQPENLGVSVPAPAQPTCWSELWDSPCPTPALPSASVRVLVAAVFVVFYRQSYITLLGLKKKKVKTSKAWKVQNSVLPGTSQKPWGPTKTFPLPYSLMRAQAIGQTGAWDPCPNPVPNVCGMNERIMHESAV